MGAGSNSGGGNFSSTHKALKVAFSRLVWQLGRAILVVLFVLLLYILIKTHNKLVENILGLADATKHVALCWVKVVCNILGSPC